MSDQIKVKPRIAVITLIQEGAVKVGGEHAMLFPYVEQVIKAAESLKEHVEVIPYVISPRPKKLEKLSRVEELKERMAETNNGKMILVSNGASGPYAHPWNWEKYGFETNKAMIRLAKERQFDAIVVMAHGFASIPAVLNIQTARENGLYGSTKIVNYFITHSTFAEHKDNRPQRRILEREIHNHAKMIAISPYMAKHLALIKMVKKAEETIPLYNALPEKGWFSTRVPLDVTKEMIAERNDSLGKGPFYGAPFPLEAILEGKKELVIYFGRAQKYVKGTDAVITVARHDKKRHYMIICSGSKSELQWHLSMITGLENVTLAWEHNSKLVLGVVQLAETNPKVRSYALFLSRREPMGLVSREVVLMQDRGTVLPIVSNHCGFDDEWQREFSFVVTNPSYGEEKGSHFQEKNSQMSPQEELFINDQCIKETLEALDSLSKLPIEELQERVSKYKATIKQVYNQNRYWSFYLQVIGKLMPEIVPIVDNILEKNDLERLPNI